MTMLLTSNGLKGKIVDIFPFILKKPASENKVLFDTTAAYGDEDNPQWFDKFKEQLRQQGITNIEQFDLRNKTEKEVKEKIANKDIIFVNGGNTFFLMHWIKKSGFDKALEEFLSEDKLYVGVSAGGIVVTPTIAIAGVEPGDENRIGLKDLIGLKLVDFEFSPHVPDVVSYESIEAYSKTTKNKIYSVDDYAAILVKDNKVSIVGGGNYRIFNEPNAN